MPTVIELLRKHLLSRIVDGPVGDKQDSLESLRGSEWCLEFENFMRNRLLMGRFRYGSMGSKPGYDNIGSAMRRLVLYQRTGNLEHLVDVANLCMVEFVHSEHPLRHFEAGDDGEHAEKNNT